MALEVITWEVTFSLKRYPNREGVQLVAGQGHNLCLWTGKGLMAKRKKSAAICSSILVDGVLKTSFPCNGKYKHRTESILQICNMSFLLQICFYFYSGLTHWTTENEICVKICKTWVLTPICFGFVGGKKATTRVLPLWSVLGLLRFHVPIKATNAS